MDKTQKMIYFVWGIIAACLILQIGRLIISKSQPNNVDQYTIIIESTTTNNIIVK